jgi:hypothetical protein
VFRVAKATNEYSEIVICAVPADARDDETRYTF